MLDDLSLGSLCQQEQTSTNGSLARISLINRRSIGIFWPISRLSSPTPIHYNIITNLVYLPTRKIIQFRVQPPLLLCQELKLSMLLLLNICCYQKLSLTRDFMIEKQLLFIIFVAIFLLLAVIQQIQTIDFSIHRFHSEIRP